MFLFFVFNEKQKMYNAIWFKRSRLGLWTLMAGPCGRR